jgi:hypothetical protein
MIPAFDRPKTVHALERAATVIGSLNTTESEMKSYFMIYTYVNH